MRAEGAAAPLLLLALAALALVAIQPLLGRSRGARGQAAVEADGSQDRLASRLENHVRRLCGELSPRDAGHPENLDRAAAWIRGELERAGGRTSEQPYQAGGETYRNVIASFGPDTRDRIVVGAHYDTAGALPGADDNASGVAGLIELAGLLGKKAPRTRVDLVAYSTEEPPWFGSRSMGSAVHAAALAERRVRVRAMICLEMIGCFRDEPGSQRFPAPGFGLVYPSRGNFIVVTGKTGQGALAKRVKSAMRQATPLPVESVVAPAAIPGVDLSDHRNYWAHGYPAVMITDTAFYRNDNYHSEGDRPETLDYRRMAMVVQGVHAAVLAEAGGAR